MESKWGEKLPVVSPVSRTRATSFTAGSPPWRSRSCPASSQRRGPAAWSAPTGDRGRGSAEPMVVEPPGRDPRGLLQRLALVRPEVVVGGALDAVQGLVGVRHRVV